MSQAADAIRTTCPYCGVGCGLIVDKRQDGTIGVKGDPEHPANFGRLCSKGTALADTIGLDGRLLTPQIHCEGASWDQALDLIAERFKTIIETDGPNAIGFYVSGQLLTEDYYAANKLMKGVIGSANIDTNSRLCMASSVAGHKRAFGSDTVPGVYEDLELADLVILTGSNLAWCHPVIFNRLRAARKRRPEMKVVLIDPRRTMTADIADHHLAIKPDGDIPLFLGLLSHLLDNGCVDFDYIAKHTNGLEEAAQIASRLSPREIASATGLDEKGLQNFYTLFARTRKVVTVYSQGVNQSRCGTDKVNAIINCHLATGRIGRPGMGPFSITGQPNAMGGREVGGLANMLACHMDIENPDHRALVGSFWGSDRLPEKQGLKAVELFDAVSKGKVKALWIMATNPVDSMPQANKIREALKICPLVIVSDLTGNTDTIQYADIQLPSLAWGEKQGTVTNSERVISRQKAFLPTPGEAKADWWQMAEVGRRMGYPSLFKWENGADIFREYATLSGHHNDGNRDFDISRYQDLTNKDYENLPPFQWPADKAGNSNAPKRFFADGGFFTPDRKARIIPVCPPEQWPEEIEDRYFILNTGRVRDHWHTMTRTGQSETLSSHSAEPYCEISTQDANALDIRDAELLRLHNEQGEIIVRSLITDRIAPGQVFVPIHWSDQFSANARVDQLLPALRDPFSGQPASKSAIVAISPFHIGSYGYAILNHAPESLPLPYWALAKCKDGWRIECAFNETPTRIGKERLARLLGLPARIEPILYFDEQSRQARYAWFDGNKLLGAIFLAAEPVSASRDFIARLPGKSFHTYADRLQALATIAGAKQKDKGKIICACMQVGSNEISDAVAGGCMTLDDVVAKTGAGSNCGSCKPEIQELIPAIAAE